MHGKLRFLLLLLGIVSSACTKPGAPPPTADCVSASDCAPTEMCLGGICVTGKRTDAICQVHDDCPVGSFCDEATSRCSGERRTCDQVTCPDNAWCEAETGECRFGPRPCTGDAECLASGLFCDVLFGECKQCVESSHCPAGWVCESGACLNERPECTHDGACRPPHTVCDSMLCVAGCNTIGSSIVCAADQVCDLMTGRCVADGGCRIDLECDPPNTVCASGACVPGCTAGGCGFAEVCDGGTGRCIPESVGNSCVMDVDCAPPVTICINSGCESGCGQPFGLACGGDQICNTDTGRCTPRPTCAGDGDCPAAAPVCEGGYCQPGCDQANGALCLSEQICNTGTGRCESPRCSSNAHCAAPTPNCNAVTGTCYACASRADCSAPTSECDALSGACFACTQDNQCASPTPLCHLPSGSCIGCTADSECSGGTPICDTVVGLCRGCQDNSECGNGRPPICDPVAGVCGGCSSNAECSGNTPICHTPSGTCQGCASNADCVGSTPACHVPSGLCLACVTNADCGGNTPLCSGATATCVGCTSTGCPGGQTCNGSTGQCEVLLGALGANCNSDVDCFSNVCFNYGQGSKCTRSCGRTSDCDNGFGCHMVSGARMCIPPSSAPSSAEEIECTIDSDCSGGNRCVWLQESQGRWDMRCRGSLGFGNPQANCNSYTDCRNGICSVGVQSPSSQFCRQPCDHDGQCSSGFFCTYIAHGGANYVQAAKGCVPVNSSFGTCSRDAHCGGNQVCKVINYGTTNGQTYLYNGCAPRQ